VLGEHFSICDAYLYTLTRGLERDGVEREKLPNVNFHFQKMEKRSSIQRIIHYHEN
jgi:glutathione S-transferase